MAIRPRSSLFDEGKRQVVKNNEAGGHLVLGDFNQTVNGSEKRASENVKMLVQSLEKEMEQGEKRSEWIDELQSFEEPFLVDEHVGLESKLTIAGLKTRRMYAFHQKEKFAKFLEKYALYSSAQTLLSICLHKVFTDFETYIHPACGNVDQDAIHQLIHEKIVSEIVAEYSYGAFSLNHSLVWGMTYWLAERCYVRWHEVA